MATRTQISGPVLIYVLKVGSKSVTHTVNTILAGSLKLLNFRNMDMNSNANKDILKPHCSTINHYVHNSRAKKIMQRSCKYAISSALRNQSNTNSNHAGYTQ